MLKSDECQTIEDLIGKNITAKKELKSDELTTNTPEYLKLLSKFLKILKKNGVPVILKREINENKILCHKFEEINIKSCCYRFATQEFIQIYNFVPHLTKLSKTKTEILFDGYLVEFHPNQNEWWLYKKKNGKIFTGKTIEAPFFPNFFFNKKPTSAKSIPAKYDHLTDQNNVSRNAQKEIERISEKSLEILEKNWHGREKIASLSLDFAIDKKGSLLVYDFDIVLMSSHNGKNEEIYLSRKEARTILQLSVNNTLILSIANFAENYAKEKRKK